MDLEALLEDFEETMKYDDKVAKMKGGDNK